MPTPAHINHTPRTDAEIVKKIECTVGGEEECTVYPVEEHVTAAFARELEVENADLRRKLFIEEQNRNQLSCLGAENAILRSQLSAAHECLQYIRTMAHKTISEIAAKV